MKFDQLIEYKKTEVFFFKSHAENKSGRVVNDLSLFSFKALLR